MNPEQRRQYRALGSRLGAFVRQQPGGLPSVSALQAVVADLAAEQGQLVLPLKDLVSRPAFPALAAKAGSGRGAVQRQALLQTMEATFAPALVEAMGEILSGFLDLPEAPAGVVKPPEPASDLGDKQGAIADYSQAIAMNPQDADAYRNRGFAKSDLGNQQGAIADYSQAIAMNPQDADAYRNRGIAYEAIGDIRRACVDWRAAASLGVADAADWVTRECQ